MVRNEHPNYSIDDFLPKETVSQLESHGFINGVDWNRMPAFDYDRMEYYPSVPRKCRELDFPFVVVDLLSQTVRVEPVPEHEIQRAAPETPFFPNGQWVPSSGTQPLPPFDQPFAIPAFLRVEFGEKESRQRRVFRLDTKIGDYLAIPEGEWPDEKLPGISAGMYRNAASKSNGDKRDRTKR